MDATIPTNVNRILRKAGVGYDPGDIYLRYHGKWRHERYAAELSEAQMNTYHQAGRIVFLPDPPPQPEPSVFPPRFFEGK